MTFSVSQGEGIDVEMYHETHLQCTRNCLQLLKVVNNSVGYTTLIIKLFNYLICVHDTIHYFQSLKFRNTTGGTTSKIISYRA